MIDVLCYKGCTSKVPFCTILLISICLFFVDLFRVGLKSRLFFCTFLIVIRIRVLNNIVIRLEQRTLSVLILHQCRAPLRVFVLRALGAKGHC